MELHSIKAQPLLPSIDPSICPITFSRRRCLSPRVILIFVLSVGLTLLFQRFSKPIYDSQDLGRSLNRNTSTNITDSDDYESAFQIPALRQATPRLAKISMLYGRESASYERALATHVHHASLHRYPIHVLRRPIADGIWNKPLYLFSTLAQELAKPAGDRVEWFMWFDADTVLLNSELPAETFLPPRHDKTFGEVDILMSKDFNGVNTGVFFLRVSQWSLQFLAKTVSYRDIHPNVYLGKYCLDQTAMAFIMNETDWRKHTVFVPQPWFNAYTKQMTKGSLLVHFAGLPDRDWLINEWLDQVETPEKAALWAVKPKDTKWPVEATSFWTRLKGDWTTRDQYKNIVKTKANATVGYKEAVEWFEQVVWFRSHEPDVINAARARVANQSAWLGSP